MSHANPPKTTDFAALSKSLEVGKFVTLCKIAPSGSLEARKLSSGAVAFYWRFTANGKSGRSHIGIYAASNPPKSIKPVGGFYSLNAALASATALAGEHDDSIKAGGGGHAHIKAAKAQAANKLIAAAQLKQESTLEGLLCLYVDYLKQQGKQSHRDVLNIVTNHLFTPYPALARMAACEVSAEDLADVIRSVIEKGKPRTANKLRSYLHAAFKIAKGARLTAKTPQAFKAFTVTNNPIADIPANAEANKADKNPIKAIELQAYWQAIKAITGKRGALLRIHLLTGGLRPQQLLRLTPAHIDGGMFTLYDIKGKRSEPRPYTTPMLAQVKNDFKEFADNVGFVFSLDGGTKPIRVETLGGWAKSAVQGIVTDFQLKRVRSGIETLLASKRISSDVRAQLQSHGISGVQAKNYDAHDYIDEKREALQSLYDALQPTAAETTTVKKSKSRA